MSVKLFIPQEALISAVRTLPYVDYRKAVLVADVKSSIEDIIDDDFKVKNKTAIENALQIIYRHIKTVRDTKKNEEDVFFKTGSVVQQVNRDNRAFLTSFRQNLSRNIAGLVTAGNDSKEATPEEIQKRLHTSVLSDESILNAAIEKYIQIVTRDIVLDPGSDPIGIQEVSNKNKTGISKELYDSLYKTDLIRPSYITPLLTYLNHEIRLALENIEVEPASRPEEYNEICRYLIRQIQEEVSGSSPNYEMDENAQYPGPKNRINTEETGENQFDLNIAGIPEKERIEIKKALNEINAYLNEIPDFGPGDTRHASNNKQFQSCIILLNSIGKESFDNIGKLVHLYRRLKTSRIEAKLFRRYEDALASAITADIESTAKKYRMDVSERINKGKQAGQVKNIEGNTIRVQEALTSDNAKTAVEEIIGYSLCLRDYIRQHQNDNNQVYGKSYADAIKDVLKPEEDFLYTYYKLFLAFEAMLNAYGKMESLFESINKIREESKNQTYDEITSYKDTSLVDLLDIKTPKAENPGNDIANQLIANGKIDTITKFLFKTENLIMSAAEVTFVSLRNAEKKIFELSSEDAEKVFASDEFKDVEKNLIANEIDSPFIRDLYTNFSRTFGNDNAVGTVLDWFLGGKKRRAVTKTGINIVKSFVYFLNNGGARTFAKGMELAKAYPMKFINERIITAQEAKDIYRLFRNNTKLRESYYRLFSLLEVKEVYDDEVKKNTENQNPQPNNPETAKAAASSVLGYGKNALVADEQKTEGNSPQPQKQANNKKKKPKIKKKPRKTLLLAIEEATRNRKSDSRAARELHHYLFDLYTILSVGKISSIISKYTKYNINIYGTDNGMRNKVVAKNLRGFLGDLSKANNVIRETLNKKGEWVSAVNEQFDYLKQRYSSASYQEDVATVILLVVNQLYEVGCAQDQSEFDLMKADWSMIATRAKKVGLEEGIPLGRESQSPPPQPKPQPAEPESKQ